MSNGEELKGRQVKMGLMGKNESLKGKNEELKRNEVGLNDKAKNIADKPLRAKKVWNYRVWNDETSQDMLEDRLKKVFQNHQVRFTD